MPGLLPALRLGATSYIVPAGLHANLVYLAAQSAPPVADMELVLFDRPDGLSNLPTPAEVAELAATAQAAGISFTVHLPLDLNLDDAGTPDSLSLRLAERVIRLTAPLEPWAVVAHLDGRALLTDRSPAARRRWEGRALVALRALEPCLGGLERLAVENLEHYPLDLLDPISARLPIARCVDVGHLWLDRADPLPRLRDALPRTRVVHLHGVDWTAAGSRGAGKDHQSLHHQPAAELAAVIDLLTAHAYAGVVTLEVFGLDDFHASRAALAPLLAV
jgi:sugar phosphate isomerase/epimerase